MSLIIIETYLDEPITDEFLTETGERVLPCLAVREADWQYSLLSSDRHRMVCVFAAPDVGAVLDSYRMADVPFSRMWSASRLSPDAPQPLRKEPILKVFEGTYPGGVSDQDWEEIKQQLLPCYLQEGIEWVQTYISRDRTRMVCEINAPDAEVIREAHRRFNIPFERVWSATVLTP